MVCLATVVRTRMWVWLHRLGRSPYGVACLATAWRYGCSCHWVCVVGCRVLMCAGQSEGYGGELRLCATIMGSGRTLVEGLYSEVGCGWRRIQGCVV